MRASMLMLSRHVTPDKVSNSEDWDLVLVWRYYDKCWIWLEDMLKRGLPPDAIKYTKLTNGYWKVNHLHEAYQQIIERVITSIVIVSIVRDGNLKGTHHRRWLNHDKKERQILNIIEVFNLRTKSQKNIILFRMLINLCRDDWKQACYLIPAYALVCDYCCLGEVAKAEVFGGWNVTEGNLILSYFLIMDLWR